MLNRASPGNPDCGVVSNDGGATTADNIDSDDNDIDEDAGYNHDNHVGYYDNNGSDENDIDEDADNNHDNHVGYNDNNGSDDNDIKDSDNDDNGIKDSDNDDNDDSYNEDSDNDDSDNDDSYTEDSANDVNGASGATGDLSDDDDDDDSAVAAEMSRRRQVIKAVCQKHQKSKTKTSYEDKEKRSGHVDKMYFNIERYMLDETREGTNVWSGTTCAGLTWHRVTSMQILLQLPHSIPDTTRA